jgi:hypothetical protein
MMMALYWPVTLPPDRCNARSRPVGSRPDDLLKCQTDQFIAMMAVIGCRLFLTAAVFVTVASSCDVIREGGRCVTYGFQSETVHQQ